MQIIGSVANIIVAAWITSGVLFTSADSCRLMASTLEDKTMLLRISCIGCSALFVI